MNRTVVIRIGRDPYSCRRFILSLAKPHCQLLLHAPSVMDPVTLHCASPCLIILEFLSSSRVISQNWGGFLNPLKCYYRDNILKIKGFLSSPNVGIALALSTGVAGLRGAWVDGHQTSRIDLDLEMENLEMIGKISRMALVAVVGALLVPAAQADVKNSKHNLGSSANAGDGPQATSDPTTGTTEVCVFCHTPHGANLGVEAPLWNKTVPDFTTFTSYSANNSVTLDATEADVGSISLACLSCHDGSQAMDVMINEPGSGGWNDPALTGVSLDGMPAMQPGVAGSPIPMLGTDLRDDHPVSLPYAGGGCVGKGAACTPLSDTGGDPDFAATQYDTINTVPQWWIDTAGGTAAKRDKSDIILYTRTDLTNTATSVVGTGPSVECASCHDPHSAAADPAVSFMRMSNDGSAICLACHIK